MLFTLYFYQLTNPNKSKAYLKLRKKALKNEKGEVISNLTLRTYKLLC